MLERNHLEPCGSSSSHKSLDSFVKIMNALMGEVYAELYFLEIPSFDTERILFVERKKGIENYRIVYKIAERAIRLSEGYEEERILEYQRKLSPDSYKILQQLFESALYQTRYPKERRIVLDGVQYYFSNILKMGKISSPEENSLIGKLIDICEKIKNMIQSDNRPLVFEDHFRGEIEALIREINGDLE